MTLWGETAKRFDGSSQPVIAVKAAKVCSFASLPAALFSRDGLVKIYSFLAQVSDFNGRTLSGGDMMIDPDIEACHELRCALFVIESNVLFYCELFW